MQVSEVSSGTLRSVPYVLGPIENNTYLLYDEETKDCVVIDPSFGFDRVIPDIEKRGLKPREIWLTHGHFDHFVGTGYPASLALGINAHMHPLDESVFKGYRQSMASSVPFIKDCPLPVMDLTDGGTLRVGKYEFTTLLTPGHSPGHCCFYCEAAGWLYSGDLVFWHSYGRTDLPGGSEDALMTSIREKVLVLPDDTLIMPGHNDFTSVRGERMFY